MPSPSKLERQLAHLRELERHPYGPEIRAEIERALGDTASTVVERAARMAGGTGDAALAAPMIAAFARYIDQPREDKGCRAKEAIVDALRDLGDRDTAPYLLGARHVQLEPVWGGRVDTAAVLRGKCAVALARVRYYELPFVMVPLLRDPEPQPREAAIAALLDLGDVRAELLLRMKALQGDANPALVGACCAGLLEIEPERSLAFVGELLASADPMVAEQAALALGGSRLPAAFDVLRARWQATTDLDTRRRLVMPLALTRCDAAFDLLIEMLTSEGRGIALRAVEALALYGAEGRRLAAVSEAVRACKDPRLTDAFAEAFARYAE